MLFNRRCCRIVSSFACLLGLAALATAAPVNPAHRLEDLNVGAAGAADVLHLPGTNRALLFSRSGDVREIVADGLLDVVVGSVPAETSCGSHGVLSATWDPTTPGVVFVTYTASRNRSLSIGSLDLATGLFAEIFNQGFAAPCTNLGGGLTFADDGTILLGVGDMEQPARAGQTTSNMGKIYRLGRNGRVPAAPLSLNPIPSSFVYSTGVRNPVRIARLGTDAWFLDAGPVGGKDELNLVAPLGNYGWGSALQSGYLQTGGLEDPHATLDATAGVSGLETWTGSALGAALDGGFVVSTRGSGEIMAIRPNLADRMAPTITPLFTRGAGDPPGFEFVRQFPDGFAHVVSSDGRWLRLAPRGGVPAEPGSRESIVPISVRKISGAIEVAVERVPGAADIGLYVGNLSTLASSGYSHQAQPPTWHPVDGASSDALVRIVPGPTELGSVSYILASARRDCLESGLGSGDAGVRPQPVLGCSVGVLGGGTHSIGNVDVVNVSGAGAMFNFPRDLAFHPEAQDELWVVNQLTHSVTIVHDAGLGTQWFTNHTGSNSAHFMAQPAALAFGPGTGFLATAHEEDDYTQGPPPGGTPPDFMGPTLWTSDSSVFNGDHISHYDMLHDSPNATGIAWETGNRYWVFDGYHRSLTRYDFSADHGPGGADHSDGVIRRFVEGQVGYAPNISSHVIVDPATGLVYAADTANGNIVMLDPTTGTLGADIFPNYDSCSQKYMNGATLTTVVDGALYGLVAPSGLELHDDMLFVSDNATSRILAFDMSGTLIDYLETGFPTGTLQGMAFDPRDGSLWLVDTLSNRLVRITGR